MKKDLKVEFLRRKNLEELIAEIKERGKFEVLENFAPFYDRRTYFKVNDLGNITLKTYNPILILFAFSNNIEKLSEYIFKYSFPEEKQNLKKIERSSNTSIKELRINLMKTLHSANLNFSKIFAKELYLRSKKDFFEILYTFSLMGNPNNIKLLYVYAMEKLFEDFTYSDNILYVAIAYLTKVRDEYSIYIEADSLIKKDISCLNITEDKKIYLDIFNKVINKYDLENIVKFNNTLYEYFSKDFKLNEDIKEVLMEK